MSTTRTLFLVLICAGLLGCQSEAEEACEHIESLREEGSLPGLKKFDGDGCVSAVEDAQDKCENVAACILKVEAGNPLETSLQLGACLKGCGAGVDAVEALGELTDRACACNGDRACLIGSEKAAREWVKAYGDARGGSKATAESHARRLAGCAPSVARVLVEAAE